MRPVRLTYELEGERVIVWDDKSRCIRGTVVTIKDGLVVIAEKDGFHTVPKRSVLMINVEGKNHA